MTQSSPCPNSNPNLGTCPFCILALILTLTTLTSLFATLSLMPGTATRALMPGTATRALMPGTATRALMPGTRRAPFFPSLNRSCPNSNPNHPNISFCHAFPNAGGKPPRAPPLIFHYHARPSPTLSPKPNPNPNPSVCCARTTTRLQRCHFFTSSAQCSLRHQCFLYICYNVC